MEYDVSCQYSPEIQNLMAILTRLPTMYKSRQRVAEALAFDTVALMAMSKALRRERRTCWALGLALMGAGFGGVSLFNVVGPIFLLPLGLILFFRGSARGELLSELVPLSCQPDACAEALRATERASWAAEWRDAVVKAGRELYVADYWVMRTLEAEQRRRDAQTQHEMTCRKLHGIA